MAPFVVNPDNVREFKTGDAFYKWLKANHDKADEVWIKIHKKGSGLPSITALEAIDVILCWGWIDGIRKGFDDKSFLQRYVPRGKKSVWSQVNQQNVARLIKEGRMTPYGIAQVDAAKADGRWDKAYGMTTTEAPEPDGGHRGRAQGAGDVQDADRAEPLRADLPRAQPQDRGRPREEDQDLRRDAEARRDDLSAEGEGRRMTRYVAFLRGVNLGKRQTKSADLKAVFESLGYRRA